MKKILLISDTHSHFDDTILKHVLWADEVWHAGDIGNLNVTDRIRKQKPLRAVYGNIDDNIARTEFKKEETFKIEGLKVLITHIGGKPPNYKPSVLSKIKDYKPDIFICGHSHILKIQYDKTNNLLHLNPGACGNHGFHKIKTMIRFKLNNSKIEEMEIIEITRDN